MLRRQDLKKRSANHNAHVVRNATQKEQRRRQYEASRESESHDAEREAGDGKQECPTCTLEWRTMREIQRHQHGAGRRRGAQNAEPLWTDEQNVRREDREERLGAAEQHGEEIE